MTHRCPACGAPIAPGSAACHACKTNVIWPEDNPAVAATATFIEYGPPVGLFVAVLAALALAAIWLLP